MLHLRHNADFIKILRFRLVVADILLRHKKDPAVAAHHLVERQQRRFTAKLIEVLGEEPYFEGQVVEFPLRITRSIKSAMCNALMRTVKELFEEYCYLTPRMPKELVVNALISEDPVHLAEYITGNIQMEVADKQAILSQSEPLKRLEILAHLLEEENDILSLEADIQEKVKGQVDKNQREYYLREQLKVISNELGEDDEQDEAADYYERIEKLKLDGQTAEKLRKEVDRLTKLPGNSNEAGVIRGYLDTVLELPWDKCTLDKIDIKKGGGAVGPRALRAAKGQGAHPRTFGCAQARAGYQGADHLSCGTAGRWQNINRAVDCKIDGT